MISVWTMLVRFCCFWIVNLDIGAIIYEHVVGIRDDEVESYPSAMIFF